MSKRNGSPATEMWIAVKKIDVQPVMHEVHKYPFLWVTFLILAFFTLGSLFEVLWMLVRDLRQLLFKAWRYPRRFVRHKIIVPIQDRFGKRYGKDAREKRRLIKKK